MSEELKRKLYNYEVNPPPATWSRIATVLGDENAPVTEKLYGLQVIPPVETWNKIVEQLETDKQKYSEKLYKLEAVPPVGTWKQISDQLELKEHSKQLHSRPKLVPWLKYAAAACVVGVIALGALFVFNRKTEHSIPPVTVLPQKNAQPVSTGEGKNSSAQETAISNNLPKEGIGLPKKANNAREKTLPQQAAYIAPMVSPAMADVRATFSNNFQQTSLREEVPGNCSFISETDPYLMFMNPDGYLIRMSKKLAETLGCVTTRGNSEDNSQCEGQLNEWRNRIAQSPANSSPDNFMDVVNIIRSAENH